MLVAESSKDIVTELYSIARLVKSPNRAPSGLKGNNMLAWNAFP